MDSALLRTLLHKSESETLDFKRDPYPFSKTPDEQKSELLKDIVAFANAWKDADAYILIGVEEKGQRAVAVPGVTDHLQDHQVQQFVGGKTNRPVRLNVETLDWEGVRLDVIRIHKDQQRPIFLNANFGGLRKQVVYVRRGSSTAEANPDEIAEMRAEDASAGTASRAVEVEFRSPEKRVRLGKAVSLVCVRLTDPPPPTEPKVTIDKAGMVTFRFSDPGLLLAARDMKLREGWPSKGTIGSLLRERADDPRALRDYVEQTAMLAPLSLWASNAGSLNATNARAEILIPREALVSVIGESQYPVRPMRSPMMVLSGHGGVRVSRDIEVEEDDEGWVVHAKLGTLQPGQQNWLEGRFFISAPLDVTLKCNCRVFADDASPVGSELRIDVQCQERHITQDDLSRSDQDG